MAVDDLQELLTHMDPVLDDNRYVFCTFPDHQAVPDKPAQPPFATIQEAEGVTWIIAEDIANQLQLQHEQSFCRITLNVHSSLTAVGLTAAVSTALAQSGISANVVAAYYHDHIFVPEADAGTAVVILKKLASTTTGAPGHA